MEYRQLGRSGLRLSTIGLGSWLTYGNQVDRERSTACVRRAFELGINFFDTADIYHVGAGETELGIALQGFTRSDYVLATKCYWPMSDNINNRGLSRKHIFESWEKSVGRLRTDYIDLYQCHRYDEDTPLDETLRALEDLVRQGKVLYAGVSEWHPGQIKAAVDYADKHDLDRIVSSQPQYNMLWRVIEKEIIPLCQKEGVGQVVWSPLAQGVLTGKYLPGQPLPPDSRGADERASGPIQGYLEESTLKAVQGLKPIADAAGMTLAQMAIAWVLRQPNVTSAITGATRPEQVDENVKASEKELGNATLDAIDEALAGLIRY
ncbi:MAG TPA: aldo/keto reductase family protein [Candidatus Dormibacteraeota bacterium]|nr:aldo/keto reductase family protein [Candidatus Dormibacteraeota bacterium]